MPRIGGGREGGLRLNPAALGLVLASAVLHVAWNAAVRRAGGSLRFVWWLTLGAGLTGLVLAGPGVLSPAVRRVYPLLLLTIAFNGTYYITLGRAYGRGDLSWVYPISRGFAVAATAPLAWVLLRQPLAPAAWVGLAVVLGGIVAMPRPAGAGAGISHWVWPVVVGALVAGYTLVDGAAVRAAPPLAYTALQHLGAALVVAPAAWRTPRSQEPAPRARVLAMASGAVSLVSYALMLYAYRLAPVDTALAVRQVAPSLAGLIGALLLGEHVPARRSLATAAIVGGAVLMVLT